MNRKTPETPVTLGIVFG